MGIAPISSDTYARVVLPLTAELWSDKRPLDRYVADFKEVAASPYGKRSFKTLAVFERDQITVSCKRYERTIHVGSKTLQGAGIGALFTPPHLRGRGFASAFLGAFLDREKQAGTDVTYLFSDIHPAFYQNLGFRELPSRLITMRADSIAMRRISVETPTERDWPAVYKCFDALESRRPWGFSRTPTVWSWIRLKNRHHAAAGHGQPVHLVTRRANRVSAYVYGQRQPLADALVIHEFGFSDEHGYQALPSLLRSAAGDLRRIIGWLPPDVARDALPQGSVRKRKDAIFMIAPLSSAAKLLFSQETASTPSAGDRIWITDHI
ncbi:MAG: GNAT family N-acetyltransferase [Candidatus Eremiobacteraeota bacterium]|nr:GNAT family N-acetyltransferase [Candidatus Eremiobacteraeota bacterium]